MKLINRLKDWFNKPRTISLKTKVNGDWVDLLVVVDRNNVTIYLDGNIVLSAGKTTRTGYEVGVAQIETFKECLTSSEVYDLYSASK